MNGQVALVEPDQVLGVVLLEDLRGQPGALQQVVLPLDIEPDVAPDRRCSDNLLDLAVLDDVGIVLGDAFLVGNLVLLHPDSIVFLSVAGLDKVFDLFKMI